MSSRELHRESTPIRRKERARVYTRRIGDWNKPSLNFAGAMCCSPLQTISAARNRQARAWVDIYIHSNENWDRHKLSPSSAGAMFSSPLQTTTAAQHHRQGATMPDWASPDAKQVERHHFLLANRCAIITVFFDISIFFRFLTPGRAIYQYRLIPLIYRHMPSLDKTHPMHRSVYSQGIPYIVVATSLSPRFGPTEKESLAKLGILGAYGSLQDGWM